MTYAPRHCARCGAPVPALLDLAAIAKRTRKALDGMRLAIPGEVTTGIRTLDSALACYSQTCSPQSPREAP